MTSYEDATDENTPRTASDDGQDHGFGFGFGVRVQEGGVGRTEVFLFGFWDIPVAKVRGRAAAAGARSRLRIERSSRLSASGWRGRERTREWSFATRSECYSSRKHLEQSWSRLASGSAPRRGGRRRKSLPSANSDTSATLLRSSNSTSRVLQLCAPLSLLAQHSLLAIVRAAQMASGVFSAGAARLAGKTVLVVRLNISSACPT